MKPKGPACSILADKSPTYTVFATAQMLRGFAQEKLNPAERQAIPSVSGRNRHGGRHGRVETSGAASCKGNRAER